MTRYKLTSSRKTSSFKDRKLISDDHNAFKMARFHAKKREKLPRGIMRGLHNPPLVSTE